MVDNTHKKMVILGMFFFVKLKVLGAYFNILLALLTFTSVN